MLRIEYISWGGQFKDAKHRWCATLPNGDVWDYGSLSYLEADARKNRNAYVVIKHHRDGTKSIAARYDPNTTNRRRA